ncbi:exodeoxyribonuclease VII small subunit [Alloscardovia theropitheci]|uniref:Exodeoxyribonuclease 7 small subunit n=1 Tax=Alloscardovia theropitheci TaxID=2496842 RepID=A0A4R0QT92_9BIFI|nr:exodeoxyribonuclease VII small subunit [Alloscardovia theropitheci]TCD54445.1 exodeoxyribonuclease VII small subunit [Alloscardovia theropitheci]
MTDTKATNHLTPEQIKEIESLTYEQARDQLVEVVQKLEAGGLELNQAVQQWELGEALSRHAQSLLDDVARKLNEVQESQAQFQANAGTQGNE